MFLEIIFITVLGLIILNRFTVFSTRETILLTVLWVMVYLLVDWFYKTQIKKK